MKKFLLVFLFFHLSSSEKHSLKFFFTGFSGIQDFPDFAGTVEVDRIQAAYCNSNKKIKPKLNWVKNIIRKDQDQVNWYKDECFTVQPHFFKTTINNLKQVLNQSEGVHVLQRIGGCEWEDETGEVDGFMKFGYDGEDFLSFDVKSLRWIALKPEGLSTKLKWDTDRTLTKHYENYLINVCPEWLKKYVHIGKSSLQRTVLPSVSLLQKSPSSPVSCHATGFFPDRAVMFWRRDGEELQEDVDHGEILPNHDGSFQMSVDLNISSVTPGDWGRYECVFNLPGVEEKIFTSLDKAPIRTNFGKSAFSEIEDHGMRNPVLVGLNVLCVILILLLVAAVVGSVFYRQRKAAKTRTEKDPDSTSMNTPSCSQPDQDHHNQEEEALNTEPLSSDPLRD